MKNRSMILWGLVLLALSTPARAELDVNALKEGSAPAAQEVEASSVDEGLKLIVVNEDQISEIKTPSGTAISVTGSSPYRLYANMDASAISKREAYARAYGRARGELVKYLEGPYQSALTHMAARNDDVVDQDKTLVNREKASAERIDQLATGILRSHLVYDVRDEPLPDGTAGDVYVTIVTSPNVVEACQVVTDGYVVSPNLKEGVDFVVEQIQKGVMPPVGARLIGVAATEEKAVVAYGSEVILSKGSRSEARRTAMKRAEVRAGQSMLMALQGSVETYHYGLTSNLSEKEQEFERIVKKDFFGNEEESVKELTEAVSTFRRTMGDTETMTSVAAGKLPAGLKKVEFRSVDDLWAYTVLIYMPSLTASAQEMAEQLDAAGKEKAVVAPEVPAPAPEAAPTDPKKPADPGRGPSGKVQDETLL